MSIRFEKVLVVDDELIIRKSLQEFCQKKRLRVKTVATVAEAEEALEGDHGFDLLFLDINLPDGEGIDILENLEGTANPPLTIMITGQGTIESAVRCMQLGAFDYLLKPFSVAQIELVLEKASKFNRLVQVNQELSAQAGTAESRRIIGVSPPMQSLKELIAGVARTDATVLISGETGTGKELIAHAIHDQSLRRSKPFIKVNCAAVSETLIESEFFGHEKGAFTGAVNSRIGRFELADGGTLLLDEISEISLPLQAKLLRVLQERELERVGGVRTIKVDVRIIATTNRNLKETVDRGDFREDLFYRLNVFPIHSPALKERREDVALIAESFLKEYARKHGRKVELFSEEVLELFFRYDWPGNVRELQNVVERAVILTPSGRTIQTTALPLEIRLLNVPPQPESSQQSSTEGAPPKPVEYRVQSGHETISIIEEAEDLSLAAVERQLILNTLRRCDGNRSRSADLMQVSIRTLRNKLAQYKAENRDEFAPFF